MTTALLVLAVAAGLACPAHMWWKMRRGERAACAPDPVRREDAEGLRRRQRDLEARIEQAGDMQASERAGVVGRG